MGQFPLIAFAQMFYEASENDFRQLPLATNRLSPFTLALCDTSPDESEKQQD
jgi:hypothetical protein